MHNDIIDNRRQKLVDHIVKLLPRSERAHFAVGYFFLSGLAPVADKLSKVKELRLLIGNTTNKNTLEHLAEAYKYLKQAEKQRNNLKFSRPLDRRQRAKDTLENVREVVELMDQTDEAESLIKTLIEMITEKRMKVRVFTKGRLHAKAYIFDYTNPTPTDNGIAIIGSSNLTLSGIIDNTEMNVLVYDKANPIIEGSGNHAALVEWFNELWEESEDFNAYLMEELKQSWAVADVTPYDIYMKTLYTLIKHRLDEGDRKEILWDDEITSQLAEFQKAAVKAAIGIIRKYNGCFVSDVVGLGKSYIGAAIVKHFQRTEDLKPLIICPFPLVEMWETYNDRFDLNAKIVSMSKLQDGVNRGIDLFEEGYRKCGFVLIDESHNFRHSGTQRYNMLQGFLHEGRKVCLVTATPYNKDAKDIYNQIKLFNPDDKTDIPIDPADFGEYFKLVYKSERQLQELLRFILIRRTRRHILRWYGFADDTDQSLSELSDHKARDYISGNKKAYVVVDEKKNYFPKRELGTWRYNIENAYNGLYQELRGYLGKPAGTKPRLLPGIELTYARYGLWRYVNKDMKKVKPYSELQRAGINLRGLIRVLLFKRLESSVHAFRETIRRLIRIHDRFLQAMDNGIIPAGEKARNILYESDNLSETQLLDALHEATGEYKKDAFDADLLHEHIQSDLGLIKDMLLMVENIKPEQDDKLQKLLSKLKKEPLNDGKILIFSQYADTAKYVYDNLNPNDIQNDIEVIYSGDKSKTKVVARFAPKANKETWKKFKSAGEIRWLVATDVLAEGLNLQDCDKIINYDLHWNPVKLIQRFGRIDRIGSQHNSIFAYNYLPETSLEKHLGIQRILAQRIKEIHETIGEDSAVLDPSEKINEDAMYAIYGKAGKQLPLFEDDDEYVDLNEAEERFRKMMKEDPEKFARIAGLRDGIRCGKRYFEPCHFIFGQAGDFQQLTLCDEKGEIITTDLQKILNKLICEPDEEGIKVTENFNEIVTKVKRRFERQIEHRKSRLRHKIKRTVTQKYLDQELRKLLEETDDENKQLQINQMQNVFLSTNLSPFIHKILNRIKANQMTGEALLKELVNIYHQHHLEEKPKEQTKAKLEDKPVRIICSMVFKD